jgi:tRNA pseudouridine55 synthase
LTEGIILLDKPVGQTSFQSLGELKRRLGTGRVGHAGTLDKFAEGLLVVLAGRMTRLCPFATDMDKEYVAAVTFGRGTDTLDPEGAVVAHGPIPSREALETVLPGFLGTHPQVPPAYSAIHVDGERAYRAARAGVQLEIAPRDVTISRLDLLDYTDDTAVLRVSCSKGTYIRALARDLAAGLKTCAYVSRLRRTRIGGFRVEDAKSAMLFDPEADVLPPSRFFDAAPGLGTLMLKEQWASRVANGMPLTGNASNNSQMATERLGPFVPRTGLWPWWKDGRGHGDTPPYSRRRSSVEDSLLDGACRAGKRRGRAGVPYDWLL